MSVSKKLQHILNYEKETGVFTWRVNRGGGARAGDIAGCLKKNGYIYVMAIGKSYLAHRLAWLFTHGIWPSEQIDHINGRRHDNRILNLRECTSAENGQNRKINSNNRSRLTGVYWIFSRDKWKAQIKVGGEIRHLGYYSTKEQAHATYLAAKADLHSFQPIPREIAE